VEAMLRVLNKVFPTTGIADLPKRRELFDIIDRNDSYILCEDFNLVLVPEKYYFNYKFVNNNNVRNFILQTINDQRIFFDPFIHTDKIS
jgi:hypothetical protein